MKTTPATTPPVHAQIQARPKFNCTDPIDIKTRNQPVSATQNRWNFLPASQSNYGCLKINKRINSSCFRSKVFFIPFFMRAQYPIAPCLHQEKRYKFPLQFMLSWFFCRLDLWCRLRNHQKPKGSRHTTKWMGIKNCGVFEITSNAWWNCPCHMIVG